MVCKLISPKCFMAVLDLKDAYHLIPIKKSHRKYLRFRFLGKLYQYNCMPFGLSTAPYVFTKLMKPLLAFLRAKNFVSVLYLDDFLLIDSSYQESLDNISKTGEILKYLGFIINQEKSQIEPSQRVRYLGFVYDSSDMTVRLPLEKQKTILRLLDKYMTHPECSIREFARFVGVLVSACPAIRYSWLYTKSLERAKYLALKRAGKDYSTKMTIPGYAREDFKWWKSHVSTCNSLMPHRFETEIFSDSSLSGWGVVCGGKATHGHWKDNERSMHINFLELLTAFFGLKCFARDLSNCSILLRIDNTTAIAYINRMGGVKYPHLHKLAKEIWQWCEKRRLWIVASYIKSSDNTEADRESRRLTAETEFELAQYAFEEICTAFQNPNIDLFASRSNTKCGRFISWFKDPEAETVDAFTVSWAKLNFYAFPPFSLIPRCLQKIMSDQARGILVVPHWPTQPWFPLFMSLLLKEPIFFKPRDNLLFSSDRKPHPLHRNLTLVAGLLSHKG